MTYRQFCFIPRSNMLHIPFIHVLTAHPPSPCWPPGSRTAPISFHILSAVQHKEAAAADAHRPPRGGT